MKLDSAQRGFQIDIREKKKQEPKYTPKMRFTNANVSPGICEKY